MGRFHFSRNWSKTQKHQLLWWMVQGHPHPFVIATAAQSDSGDSNAIGAIVSSIETILVHNIDDSVIRNLKSMAAQNGRSMEEQARLVFDAFVGMDRQPKKDPGTEIGNLSGNAIVKDEST
jgi:hypothetical protein